jgi:hypothetical protein
MPGRDLYRDSELDITSSAIPEFPFRFHSMDFLLN